MRPLPGFRDFYPAECARRNHIFAVWRRVAASHGFSEYDGPPLEPLDLYTRKSGAEIVKQLYEFTDKGERQVALRPELTPTFARMVAARHKDYRKPIKWFAVPQLFRYERQQKGRLREHFQLNADVAGTGSAAEDAEILALLAGVLSALGLSHNDCRIRLSSREIWSEFLASLGLAPELHGAVFAVVDKIEREPVETLRAKLAESGISQDIFQRVFDFSQNSSLGAVPAGPARDRLAAVLEILEAYGVSEYLTLDFKIVRGLAYYTGLVFEAFAVDAQGHFTERAVAGGGRYDSLVKTLAGVDLPAAGFGMGDVVLGNLLEEKGLFPDQSGPPRVFVVRVAEDYRVPALRLVAQLRKAGFAAETALKPMAVGKQFEAAEHFGAAVAVVCDDKMAEGIVGLKNLASRHQIEIPMGALPAEIAKAAAARHGSSQQ